MKYPNIPQLHLHLSLLKMRIAGFVMVGVMALLLALFPEACNAQDKSKQCTSSCGTINNISFPFRLKDDPHKCGDRNFELECENNRTTLSLFSGKYYVQHIFYDNHDMIVVDASLDDHNGCSLPRYSLTHDNFSDFYSYSLSSFGAIVLMNCTKAVHSSRYVDATSCINNSSFSSPNTYFYALYGDPSVSDILENCSVQVVVPAYELSSNSSSPSIFDIHRQLLEGFYLSYCYGCVPQVTLKERLRRWTKDFRHFVYALRHYLLYESGYHNLLGSQFYSSYDTTVGRVASYIIKGYFLGRTFLGILCLIAFLIYKFRRRHLSIDDTIEEFLGSHNNLMPIRYSYKEIKDITKGFKDKLGQGGFGSVYKGKLISGYLVAVKVLSTSKSNGQDFINEVATIGRIHHVNVVRLTGFCVEGSKRALIYEFMVNGSLDKFVSHKGENINLLSWERMYEIALGVARGIEYLHRGCDKQILHFDIKPHNILLDENFIPKVSDFGLAKLYPVDDSIVSLTVARGTPGYIAPELFYKNIGGVSYKADVYSFGMLLMEMIGKRKKENASTEHLSYSTQIFFPSWVHDRMSQGEDIELGDINEDENKIVRKMVIVALWCIQIKPMDRPSMSKVLAMLQGEVELLQMPPKPLMYPQEMSVVDNVFDNPRGASNSSYNDIGTITLDVR